MASSILAVPPPALCECRHRGLVKQKEAADGGLLVKSHALPLSLAGHLVLQRKRADCGIASSVIAALCHLGGENANRQSEHERGGDSDYALGHHGSPLGLEVTLHT